MKTTETSIATIKAGVKLVIPKPTRRQMIDCIVNEVIKKREAQNVIARECIEKLKKHLDKEREKFKKTSVKLANLDINWENAGAFVYIRPQTITGSPKMQFWNEKIKSHKILDVSPDVVRCEVEKKIEKEMMASIMAQPGVVEGIQSAIAKIGI